ncbi:HMCN1 [Branchiostoma lanceolatum]|uniref:HMCN1 protein n=1 Tax=Branchiostoma lanceolatum TaxID=7740 RepID=A0A8J9ZF22_BRALA|nr:HMCN1 [Branchiostoma lanceolatum]
MGPITARTTGTELGPITAHTTGTELGPITARTTGTELGPITARTTDTELGAITARRTDTELGAITARTTDTEMGPITARTTGTELGPITARTTGTELGPITARTTGTELGPITAQNSQLSVALLFECTVIMVTLPVLEGRFLTSAAPASCFRLDDFCCPPHITQGPRSYNLSTGEAIKLRCETIGVLTPTITWLKDGHQVPQDGRHVWLPGGGLQLIRVGLSEAGLYTCLAENRFGQDRASAVINVTGPPLPEDASHSGVIAGVIIAVLVVFLFVGAVLLFRYLCMKMTVMMM